MTKVLITGGSGFVGQHLAKKLLDKGQDVIIYDIQKPPDDLMKDAIYIEGDIRDDNKVSKALKGVDVVYHSAALVSIADAGNEFWGVNSQGSNIVATEALRRDVKKFVYISSSSVYDLSQKMPLTELSIVKNGDNSYAGAKYLGEQMIQRLSNEGLNTTIIRPRTIIGKGRGGIFQILFDWLRQGKHIYIIGKGNNLFQMLWVDDLCDCCIASTETDKSIGQIFNVGTDKYSTMKDDLQTLIEYADTGSRIVTIPIKLAQLSLSLLHLTHLSPLVPFHYHSMYKPFYCDITKAEKLLNWKPKYGNKEMLIEAYDWYKEHYKEFKKGRTHIDAPKQKILGLLRDLS